MKKLVLFVALVVFGLSFVSCGSKPESTTVEKNSVEKTQQEEPTGNLGAENAQ
jgi:uncharacterized protein YcfL